MHGSKNKWWHRWMASAGALVDRLVMALLRPGLRYVRWRMRSTLSERSRLRLNDYCHDMQVTALHTPQSTSTPVDHADVNRFIQAAQDCANGASPGTSPGNAP